MTTVPTRRSRAAENGDRPRLKFNRGDHPRPPLDAHSRSTRPPADPYVAPRRASHRRGSYAPRIVGTSTAMSDSNDRGTQRADVADGDRDPGNAKEPSTDPDAPGAGVDDDDSVDVPEPNEPA